MFFRLKSEPNSNLVLHHNLRFWITATFIYIGFNSIGQIPNVPKVKTPTQATLKSNVIIGTQTNNTEPIYVNPNYTKSFGTDYAKINNQTIMEEVERNETKRNEPAIYNELNPPDIQYKFPSLNHPSQVVYYNAFKELQDMIEGRAKIDLKRAVFISENTFLNNRLSYENYTGAIDKMINICHLKHEQAGFSWNNQEAKIHTLHQFMSDTFAIKIPGQEQMFTHYPMTYDFEDFRGEEDWTKLFVTKLMVNGSGQCHSLPLLFLILAQELDAEAYLAFAPSHSYIKFPDSNGNWHNLELTNGMLTSDAFIVESGYIKAEALMNKIFMDTISIKKTVAFCMVDLVKGYVKNYGYDQFVLDVANYALKQNNDDVFARMIKANYHTALSMYVVKQMGYPKLETVLMDTKAKEIFEARDESYGELNRVGYEEMPKEVYQSWLKSMEKEKMKKEHQDNYLKLKKVILKR